MSMSQYPYKTVTKFANYATENRTSLPTARGLVEPFKLGLFLNTISLTMYHDLILN